MFSIRSLLPISASVSVPTKQSQSIATILGGRTIEKMEESEGLLVFLGKKTLVNMLLILLDKMFQEL
ncbi:T3SS secreted effector OspB [Escherichia coli]|nr:T3SS secreted effector OspB [Escherichia coli]